jgi:hypothetical protein
VSAAVTRNWIVVVRLYTCVSTYQIKNAYDAFHYADMAENSQGFPILYGIKVTDTRERLEKLVTDHEAIKERVRPHEIKVLVVPPKNVGLVESMLNRNGSFAHVQVKGFDKANSSREEKPISLRMSTVPLLERHKSRYEIEPK